jgi:phosphoglycerate dehydrogenase-like enzyme
MMYIASASMPADEVSRGRALDRAKLADAIDAMRAFGAATKHAEEEEEKKGMVVANEYFFTHDVIIHTPFPGGVNHTIAMRCDGVVV